ncbi:MAG: TetR/AcrR family transcriptional regulator [Actinomycetota bacterium]
MAKARTTRIDWIDEALRVIHDEGVDGVRVESIARRLKVSKGGFYYNFQTRDELLSAALVTWEERSVAEVINLLEREELPPRARLEQLFDLASWDQRVLRVDAALAAASLTGDTQVKVVYERIHARRLAYVASIYAELGYDESEAERWARGAYATWLGTAQLVALDRETFGSDVHLERHRHQIRAIVVPPERD